MSTTYQERPRKGGGTECCLNFASAAEGNIYGNAWRKLLPIAFTAENAQKVHDGTKTQTRRLFKWRETGVVPSHPDKLVPSLGLIRSARYQVGDVLWVQEPWRTLQCDDDVRPTLLDSISAHVQIHHEGTGKPHDFGKLRPGRFLPLRFARPDRYEVTEVRLERVNEITGKDIWAEGMTKAEYEAAPGDLAWWRQLWNSIYDAPGTRFEDGPWVFAYTFKRIQS